MNRHIGLIYAVCAYTWWGIIPIFWKQISYVSALEIVLHRMVWACLLVLALIILMRQWGAFISLFRQTELVKRLAVASILMSANWGIFIWAVNASYLVEVSMGYFINPLITVLFGVIFFGERLRRGQLIAMMVMAIGVLYLVVAFGDIPYIALSLALSFACYSLVKKTITVPATHGMAMETVFMLIPAALYLLFLEGTGQGVFGAEIETDFMLILGGLMTLIPLLLFSAAAKRVSMTVLGMSQYLGPTIQLLIGVFIYKEGFGKEQFISFGLIWLALMIYSFDQLSHRRRRETDLTAP